MLVCDAVLFLFVVSQISTDFSFLKCFSFWILAHTISMLIVTATCKRIDHTEIEAVSNVSIKDVAISPGFLHRLRSRLSSRSPTVVQGGHQSECQQRLLYKKPNLPNYQKLSNPGWVIRVSSLIRLFDHLRNQSFGSLRYLKLRALIRLARIIWSWQCCRLLVGNIANGIASKIFFAFLTELGNFKQKYFWRQCHWQCCQTKVCSIVKSR